MSYDFVGCMIETSAGWAPAWSNPCASVPVPIDLIGCMIETSAGWAPKLPGGFNKCTDDLIGCMEFFEGKWRPVLTFDEYDDLEELIAGCCGLTCGTCTEEFEAPQFIEATFAGIEICGGGAPPAGINDTFVLEFVEPNLIQTQCIWRNKEFDSTGLFCEVTYANTAPGAKLRFSCTLWSYGDQYFTLTRLGEADDFPECEDVTDPLVFNNTRAGCTAPRTQGQNGTVSITGLP